MSTPHLWDLVSVRTDSFPKMAPRGTMGRVVAVSSANHPPVPYFAVQLDQTLGGPVMHFYADEIRVDAPATQESEG